MVLDKGKKKAEKGASCPMLYELKSSDRYHSMIKCYYGPPYLKIQYKIFLGAVICPKHAVTQIV